MNNCYVVMGVSGSGKTTIGNLLAEKAGVPFLDADDFHPPANIEKMKSGQPLNDEDRRPWLFRLAEEISNADGGCVLACSALKASYREILASGPRPVIWVYLEATKELIRERLKERSGHFMPPSLLDSQFEALEVPKNAIVADVSKEPDEVVQMILSESAERE
ncbi:gluconokinase [Fulvivirga sedimenti]|uniref:Gluconokinase n=1 Tax=Fulvivirga sedimenti TaxID=2879465 RepID=A0A9X1HMS7_9BACT|nr:gluconokinase [Fulvivirga sedimenti]MCA6073452.1 gluconokinase [Fulvivirga sedimenti]